MRPDHDSNVRNCAVLAQHVDPSTAARSSYSMYTRASFKKKKKKSHSCGTAVPQQVNLFVGCGCGDRPRWVVRRSHALEGSATTMISECPQRSQDGLEGL